MLMQLSENYSNAAKYNKLVKEEESVKIKLDELEEKYLDSSDKLEELND